MNSLDFDCDWRFGFNVSSQRKGTVGYLLSFSGLGGMNLQKDMEVWNPFNAPGQNLLRGSTIRCIGLLESFRFDGGERDPIQMSAYVSKGTSADLLNKLARPISNTKVSLAWYIIDYDEERKCWFESAFVKSPKNAAACIDTSGGDLQLFVSQTPTKIMDTLDVNVYRMDWRSVPVRGKKNLLEFASGPNRRLIRAWEG